MSIAASAALRPKKAIGWSLAGWSAANTHVRTANERVAMAFRPDYSKTIEKLWFYIRTAGSACDSSSTGYGAGNSGTCNVKLYKANPSTSLPTGSVLYEESFNPCTFSSGDQSAIYISPNLVVEQGQLYVIVIANTDATPGTNWFSLNCCAMEPSGVRPDLAYVGVRPGERVRSSTDGGSTWTETGLYGTMLPTYMLEYTDGTLQAFRTRGLFGTSDTYTDVTVEYPALANRTIVGLGAYCKSGSGTSTLSLLIDDVEVRSGEVTVSAPWQFGRVEIAPYTVGGSETVKVRSNGTITIFRSGSLSAWTAKTELEETVDLPHSHYLYSVYPFVV